MQHRWKAFPVTAHVERPDDSMNVAVAGDRGAGARIAEDVRAARRGVRCQASIGNLPCLEPCTGATNVNHPEGVRRRVEDAEAGVENAERLRVIARGAKPP